MADNEYKDIIDMKYPDPEIEADFPVSVKRAALFAPFDALTGYDDAVMETARITDYQIELDENEKQRLNNELLFLFENINKKPEVSFTYFIKDEKKSGGAYITTTGIIKKYKENEKTILLENKKEIPIEDIVFIKSDILK